MKKFLERTFKMLGSIVILMLLATPVSADTLYSEYFDFGAYDDGDFLFTIVSEEAAYESAFGLFSGPTGNTPYDYNSYAFFEIFAGDDEAGASVQLYIDWSVYAGFYAGVYTSGTGDTDLDYDLLGGFNPSTYTDTSPENYFKSGPDPDGGILLIYIDDQVGGSDDGDFNDMIVRM